MGLQPVRRSRFTVSDMEDLMTTDACTMPTAERPLRLAEFDDLFASAARRVTRTDDGVLIHFVGTADLREQVRSLATRESACCSFFKFVVEGREDDITLLVSVPPERRSILDALAARAEAAIA
jgi:hypothetical protein